ncbi:MAG: hypothetical protein N2314_01550 [Brevinematales bacterium]|nr:hypothetical protein [Brevinematales bacterium]
MKRNRITVFLFFFFVWLIGRVYAQSTELSLASQAIARGRWEGSLTYQMRALSLSASNFLSRVQTVLPLPLGMVRLGMTNSYYFTFSQDFVDYEYRVVAVVSNENFVSTITWLYSASQNERLYNLMKSLPYLTQTTLWWQSRTNQGMVYTLWREKSTYTTLRVLQEKDNTLEKGFCITIEVNPIKKLPTQVIEEFVWEYVTKSDWRDVERMLR